MQQKTFESLDIVKSFNPTPTHPRFMYKEAEAQGRKVLSSSSHRYRVGSGTLSLMLAHPGMDKDPRKARGMWQSQKFPYSLARLPSPEIPSKLYHQMMFFSLLMLLAIFWSHLTSGAELIGFAKTFHYPDTGRPH